MKKSCAILSILLIVWNWDSDDQWRQPMKIHSTWFTLMAVCAMAGVIAIASGPNQAHGDIPVEVVLPTTTYWNSKEKIIQYIDWFLSKLNSIIYTRDRAMIYPYLSHTTSICGAEIIKACMRGGILIELARMFRNIKARRPLLRICIQMRISFPTR